MLSELQGLQAKNAELSSLVETERKHLYETVKQKDDELYVINGENQYRQRAFE